MKLISELWAIISNTDFWVMNHLYDAQWDDRLKRLMYANKFVPDLGGKHWHKLDEVLIWTANYPHASMRPCSELDCHSPLPLRPSRLTILRAYRKLLHDRALLTAEYRCGKDWTPSEK